VDSNDDDDEMRLIDRTCRRAMTTTETTAVTVTTETAATAMESSASTPVKKQARTRTKPAVKNATKNAMIPKEAADDRDEGGDGGNASSAPGETTTTTTARGKRNAAARGKKTAVTTETEAKTKTKTETATATTPTTEANGGTGSRGKKRNERKKKTTNDAPMTDNPLFDAEASGEKKKTGEDGAKRTRNARAGKTSKETETTGDERAAAKDVAKGTGRSRRTTDVAKETPAKKTPEKKPKAKSTPRAVEDATETKNPRQRERKQRPRDSVTSPIPSRQQPQQRQSRQPTSERKASPAAPALPPLPIAAEDARDWLSSRTRDALRMENSLWAWVRADGGRELIHELKESMSCGDGHVTMKVCEDVATGDLFVGLECDGEKFTHALTRVNALVEATLGDLARIRRRTAAANMLENERRRIQDEITAGLRCEFTLGYKAMQDLLMDGGEKLNHVRSVCDIDRVVVDQRKRTIRIVGKDALEVSRARDMLEVAHETIEDVPELALRMIVGKGGAKVTDIQQRTGANINIGWDKNAVYIRGAPSAVKSAMILVKSCIKTYEVEHVEVTYEDLDEVRDELARLDMEWGGSNVHYTPNRGPRSRATPPHRVA
jgi:hypothetical protein